MGLSKIFGFGEVKNQPKGINAGGLKGLNSLNRLPERQNAIEGVSAGLSAGGQAFGDLRRNIMPGLNASSRLQDLENARLRATGNLRENLRRRRVLGSSFAGDALARADAEFAGEADKIKAQATLQEAQVTSELIAKETQARVGAFQSVLNNLNFEAALAEKMTGAANQIMAQNARQEAAAKQANTSGVLGFGTRLFGLG